ncbi:MAG: GNAT family N-acetyltransferase [Lachnospiraceae bacterium]|nr:GNAT family N-acetyltransferase [Ruminococcus sp.]MCM1274842.1 GNAT family N-acetyltransferase [Lachnospiraceae bacterium]
MRFEIRDCPEEELDEIYDGLTEHIFQSVPELRQNKHFDINKKITDEDGNIIAGCVANGWWWKAVYVDTLWVSEEYRRKGLGSILLGTVERIAAENGCTLIHLDTFDFQAKDFYIKQGYEVFGVLENSPEGHCRYYLKKNLKGN